MSWVHVKRALESDLKGLDKLVYIMIANHVNDAPKHPKCGLAWPSVTTIARETGIGRSTVNRALNRLEAGGFLTRENHGTRSTHYRLSVPERDTNARARERPTADEVPERDTNTLVAQSGTGGVPERDSGCPRAGHKSPKEPLNEPEKKKPPSGGASASLRALGSEQSNPASSAHDCARGGSGVKSADAKNEEKRWRLYQEHIAELKAAGYQTAGMDPPQAAIAVIDLRIENKKKSQSLRLQNEKNGQRPSDAPTSDTESVAHCQGP